MTNRTETLCPHDLRSDPRSVKTTNWKLKQSTMLQCNMALQFFVCVLCYCFVFVVFWIRWFFKYKLVSVYLMFGFFFYFFLDSFAFIQTYFFVSILDAVKISLILWPNYRYSVPAMTIPWSVFSMSSFLFSRTSR